MTHRLLFVKLSKIQVSSLPNSIETRIFAANNSNSHYGNHHYDYKNKKDRDYEVL